MKLKIYLSTLLIILFTLFIAEDVLAQKKGGPPPWAPAHGYRERTRHIYFPQQNVYYDVERSVYIYLNNGNWEIGARIPKGINANTLRDSRQVELVLNSDQPQKFNSSHIKKYRDKADPAWSKKKRK